MDTQPLEIHPSLGTDKREEKARGIEHRPMSSGLSVSVSFLTSSPQASSLEMVPY